jgi:glucose dehydrogenase
LILSISTVAIMLSSTIFVALPSVPSAHAQQKVVGADWLRPNNNIWAQSYSPQTQITKDNVNQLEIKWIFPIPPSPDLSPLPRAEGSMATPMVKDGIVYVGTNYFTIIALTSETGRSIWSTTYKFDVGAAVKELPIRGDYGGHQHGISYYRNMLWITTADCGAQGINALTGKIDWSLSKICKNIPGNNDALMRYRGQLSYAPSVYEPEGIVIMGGKGPGSMSGQGRGYIAAYSFDTKQMLWRWFVTPPWQGDPDWDFKQVVERPLGVMNEIPRSAFKGNVEPFRGDWGGANTQYKPWPNGQGSSIGWGQFAVDEETATLYIATSQAGPDWNATYRPGPNLYADAIAALDVRTGVMKWFFQSVPHDINDFDCAWNVMLAKVRIGNQEKKVVYKTCKQGIIHALDAATGDLLWNFDPPNIKWLPGTEHGRYAITGKYDPFKPWFTYPSPGPGWECPAANANESDLAIDPTKNIIVHVTHNLCAFKRAMPVDLPFKGSSQTVPGPYTMPRNVSVWAVDASTGKPKWDFFIPEVTSRGGATLTQGMAFVPGSDGNLYALDIETGKEVWRKYFGSPLDEKPSFAADSKGKMMMFQVYGGRTTTPGALIAFGLPDKLPQPQVITKEVIKEVPKEVIKEVVKEVPKEVIKEVVKEVPKEVTKTVTVETISPLSYAAIGIGVVLVVIAGVIFSRRKKV